MAVSYHATTENAIGMMLLLDSNRMRFAVFYCVFFV